MKFTFDINATIRLQKTFVVTAGDLKDATDYATNIIDNASYRDIKDDDDWLITNQVDLRVSEDGIRPIVDAVYASDSSYVMDRKAQIDWLTNYCDAWDKLMSNNALSETLINALSGELHLFYDANDIAYDCAEAVLNRLEQEGGTRPFKLQRVEFSSVVFEFTPTQDDQWVRDGCFWYHYEEKKGVVTVIIGHPLESVGTLFIHEQPIQW
jgi:hypothetical protein